MNNTQTVIALKKQVQFVQVPRLVVSDLDGTLFTPDVRIIYEMFLHNKHIRTKLRQQHIPLIINTARRDWEKKEKHDARILGIHPDTVIAGTGTVIYHKNINGDWIVDTGWKTLLSNIWSNKKVDKDVDTVVKIWKKSQKCILKKTKGNNFQIRYKISNTETKQLPLLAASLQKEVSSNTKILYTESLYSNRLGFPTGYLIVVPEIAGKDNSLTYLLNSYAAIVKRPIEVYCFGDGAADLASFLIMPSSNKYRVKQFLVHPTALAKHIFSTLPPSERPSYLPQRGLQAIEQIIL